MWESSAFQLNLEKQSKIDFYFENSHENEVLCGVCKVVLWRGFSAAKFMSECGVLSLQSEKERLLLAAKLNIVLEDEEVMWLCFFAMPKVGLLVRSLLASSTLLLICNSLRTYDGKIFLYAYFLSVYLW